MTPFAPIASVLSLVLVGSGGEPAPGPADEVAGSDPGPRPVVVERHETGWRLLRDGKPLRLRGAGGTGSLELLAAIGGNATRTWGVGPETPALLDEAQRHGIGVVVGFWVAHERHGFVWRDPAAVAWQHAEAMAMVRQYRHHPAVLAWSFGNEAEVEGESKDLVWDAIEAMAAEARSLDPDHPTMTVIADLGSDTVAKLNQRCPSLQLIGINSYGGAPSIPARYRQAGGTRPYVQTEYGPLGIWEIGRNPFGAYDEPTSTAKVATWLAAHDALAADQELCLGSFAFTWGAKQEVTGTWFGMLLADGSRTAVVDALAERWGRPVLNHCPVIEPLRSLDPLPARPGARIAVAWVATDPEGDAVVPTVELRHDSRDLRQGGDREDTPDALAHAATITEGRILVDLPATPGNYRLFLTVRDRHQGAATANLVLAVASP